MTYDILVGGQRVRVNSALSYESTEKLDSGQLVIVPLRDQTSLGVVVRQSTDFHKKIKAVQQVLPYKLTKEQLQLMQWMAAYYPSPISAIAQLFLPGPAINKVLESAENSSDIEVADTNLPTLTTEQTNALINESEETNYILHGVTGSGKTRVYAALAKAALENGKSVIAMTPEIGLTTPMVTYFENAFGKDRVVCFHSQLSASARAKVWSRIANSTVPLIIIGPRSALFLPVKNLGLIVVDEAHDAAYKQEQQPFYNATRVAAKLAKLYGAKCILGSATPPLGDYFAFASRKLPIIQMVGSAIKSDFTRKDVVIDLKNRQLFDRSTLLSTPLITAIDQALKENKQTLLFLNRRGSARTILCKDCGWQAVCPNCDIALTYHADNNHVLCHVCAFQQQVPMACPDCHGNDIVFQTPGTKSIEAEVSRLFPDANAGRYDKDSSAGTKLHQTFDDVKSGKIDILVGTQLLSKGLDLPQLSVIGLVQADSSMALPDFSATERTFQQISQVAGRLGRGHGDGKLFVQTFQPDRALIKWALAQDYESFYENELKERLQYNFPPAVYLLTVQVKRATQAGAMKAIKKIGDQISGSKDVHIGNPAPCFHEKRSGHYYWQIVVRSKNRTKLIDVINKLPAQTLFNIDPSDLL
jgi:primosomal protein N' (replication factor Y)